MWTNILYSTRWYKRYKEIGHKNSQTVATLGLAWSISWSSCLIVKQVVKVIWQQAASPTHMNGSMVFARCRHCAPHLINSCLGLPDSKSQTASPSIQPCLHTAAHSRADSHYTLQRTASFPPQNCPFPLVDLDPPSNAWFPGPTQVFNPNDISIGSAVFAGLITMADRPTDRPRYGL